MNRELHSCIPKCNESRNGNRRATAAFPAVETEVADAAEADIAQKFGAAPTTDDDKRHTRMPREAAQYTAGRGHPRVTLEDAARGGAIHGGSRAPSAPDWEAAQC